MFCPKCGAKAPDDAGFCQKCGAKLTTDTLEPTSTSSAQQPSEAKNKASKKKKSKKLPLILGAVTLVIIIMAMGNLGGSERNDVTVVRDHKPFNNLPYTFAEVLDQCLSGPLWSLDSKDEGTGVSIVKIDGVLKDTNHKVTINIKVTRDTIRPEFVTFDGIKSPSQNDAIDFLNTLFLAYEEDLSHLSAMFSGWGAFERDEDIELSELYTNAGIGLSFRYPDYWNVLGGVEGNDWGGSISFTNHTFDVSAVFEVLDVTTAYEAGMLGDIFTEDINSLEGYFNQQEGTTVLAIEDITISGVPVRLIKAQTGSLGSSNAFVRNYYYTNGGSIYRIFCSRTESAPDIYEKVFDAIIDSYTITPIESVAPSQDAGSTEAPQNDPVPNTQATTGFVGTWMDSAGIYQMEISGSDDVYTINISQTLNDSEWRQWVLDGNYEQNFGLYCYGTYVEQYLRDDGTAGIGSMTDDVNDIIYFGDDGALYWDDSVLGLSDIRLIRQ